MSLKRRPSCQTVLKAFLTSKNAIKAFFLSWTESIDFCRTKPVCRWLLPGIKLPWSGWRLDMSGERRRSKIFLKTLLMENNRIIFMGSARPIPRNQGLFLG